MELQYQLNRISFKKIPAYKTSQICSCCGKEGLRKGKLFICKHCNLHLDADLNAARNIAQYKTDNKKKKHNIEPPYMGAQDCHLPVIKEDVRKCPDF
ncbi:MAG: transposase [Candidatus Lokiarchaeota archaeon]|nr:transposase [Candidatus Lokiarchaeota archaeon]